MAPWRTLVVFALWSFGAYAAHGQTRPGSVDLIYELPGEMRTIRDIEILDANSLLVIGELPNRNYFWTKVHADSPPDPVVVFDPPVRLGQAVQSLGDGRFLVADGSRGRETLRRYLPDGTLDPTFLDPVAELSGTSRLILLGPEGGFWWGNSVLGVIDGANVWLSSLGKYSAEGEFTEEVVIPRESRLLAIRLLVDGTLGIVTSAGPLGLPPGVSTQFQDRAGRFVGRTRLLPDGSTDPTFAPYPSIEMRAADEFPDGKLLVFMDRLLRRLTSTGDLDGGFVAPREINGIRIFAGRRYVAPDGKVIAPSVFGDPPLIARLHGGDSETMPPEIIRATGGRIASDSDRIRLEIAVAGVPLPSIQWLKDGLAIEGATQPWFDFDRRDFSDTGVYTARATSPLGSVEVRFPENLDSAPTISRPVGSTRITIFTVEGRDYQLEVSANLRDWSAVGPTVPGNNALQDFSHHSAAAESSYRIRVFR